MQSTKEKLSFKPLTLSDMDRIRKFFNLKRIRACDYTLGCFFMWRDYYSLKFDVQNDALFSVVTAEDGKEYYNLPLSLNVENSLLYLIENAPISADGVMRFYTVTEEYLGFFRSRFDCSITEQPEHFDYVYAAKDLAELAGKKYAGQRNMLHQFSRQCAVSEYLPIGENNLPSVIDFFKNAYLDTVIVDTPTERSEREENLKTLEVLENFGKYGFFGGVLYSDGKIAGFSLGEKVGDTVYVHIEKADRNVKGAYQTVVNEFAKNYAQNASFINREDDMGDVGLKTSKLSYHPVELVKKYKVEIRVK